MNDETKLPNNGRLIAAGLSVAASMALVINHFMAGTQNILNLVIICVGPIGLFPGIGGLIEPKILFSVGKYGTHLPFVYKLIGGILGILGVLGTILLLLFDYPLDSLG